MPINEALRKSLNDKMILLFVKIQNIKNPKLTRPNLKLSAANGDESFTIALLVTNADAHNTINNSGNRRVIYLKTILNIQCNLHLC